MAFTSTTTSTNLHLPILWLFVGDYGAFQIELTYAWNYLIDLGKTECQSLEATVVGPEGGVFVESRDGQRVNAAQRHPFIAESPIEVRDQAAGRADLDHVNSWRPAAAGSSWATLIGSRALCFMSTIRMSDYQTESDRSENLQARVHHYFRQPADLSFNTPSNISLISGIDNYQSAGITSKRISDSPLLPSRHGYVQQTALRGWLPNPLSVR